MYASLAIMLVFIIWMCCCGVGCTQCEGDIAPASVTIVLGAPAEPATFPATCDSSSGLPNNCTSLAGAYVVDIDEGDCKGTLTELTSPPCDSTQAAVFPGSKCCDQVFIAFGVSPTAAGKIRVVISQGNVGASGTGVQVTSFESTSFGAGEIPCRDLDDESVSLLSQIFPLGTNGFCDFTGVTADVTAN